MAYQTYRTSYKPEDEIRDQYDAYRLSLLNGRDENELDTLEKETLVKLEQASQLDPRLPGVMFLLVGEALRGVLVAKTLDEMTDDEFSTSPRVFGWVDDFKGSSIFRVVNKEAVDAIGVVDEKDYEQQIFDWVHELVINSLRSENYSGKKGERYFLTGFEINIEDDFEMASEIRGYGRNYVDKLIAQECATSDYWGGDTALLIAECSMLGAYVLTKLGYGKKITDFRKRVFKTITEGFLKDDRLDFIVAIGGASFAELATPLYTHCASFGKNLASR